MNPKPTSYTHPIQDSPVSLKRTDVSNKLADDQRATELKAVYFFAGAAIVIVGICLVIAAIRTSTTKTTPPLTVPLFTQRAESIERCFSDVATRLMSGDTLETCTRLADLKFPPEIVEADTRRYIKENF